MEAKEQRVSSVFEFEHPSGCLYFILFDSKISDAYWETERS